MEKIMRLKAVICTRSRDLILFADIRRNRANGTSMGKSIKEFRIAYGVDKYELTDGNVQRIYSRMLDEFRDQ